MNKTVKRLAKKFVQKEVLTKSPGFVSKAIKKKVGHKLSLLTQLDAQGIGVFPPERFSTEQLTEILKLTKK